MSEDNPKTKIEIRLEFRQLVVLGLTTMVGSGVLFGLGYHLGTAYGLLAQPEPPAQERRSTRAQRDALKPSDLPIAEGKPVPAGSVSEDARSLSVKSTLTMKPTAKVNESVQTPSSIRVLPKLKNRVTASSDGVKSGLRPKLPDWPVTKTKVSASLVAKNEANIVPSDKGAHAKDVDKFAMVARNLNGPPVPKGSSAHIVKSVQEETTKEKIDTSTNVIEVANAPSAKKALASGQKSVTQDVSKREGSARVAAPQKQGLKPKQLTTSLSSKGRQTKSDASTDWSRASSTSPNLNALKPVPAPSLSIHGAEHFTVQLKSIPSRKAAEDFSKKLISKGYTPDVVLADIPKVGRYYRIRVGKFRRLGDAQRLQRSLSSHGLTRERPIITRY